MEVQPHDAHAQLYAGHVYRRSMLEEVKLSPATTVRPRPFTSRLINDVPDVEVDEFATYEATALTTIKHQIAAACLDPEVVSGATVNLHHLATYRVFLPAYLVEYRHMNRTWRVFVNGVDGRTYGLEQRNVALRIFTAASQSPAGLVLGLLHLLLPGTLVRSVALAVAASLYDRAAVAWAHRKHDWAWESARRREADLQRAMHDDWVYRAVHGLAGLGSGAEAERGAEEAEEGFESGFRRAAEEAEREARAAAEAEREARRAEEEADAEKRARERRRREAAARERAEARERERASARSERAGSDAGWWRNDLVYEDDYYQVLALPGPTATTAEVKRAFRKQMLKWHPDHAERAGVPRAVAEERTRVVMAAYAVLRSAPKRQAYDASYVPRPDPRRERGRGWWNRWT